MAPKVRLIIDTDPGTDDTLAILLALTTPDVEILGYIVSYGNSGLDESYANIFRIYQAVQKEIDHNPEAAKRYPGFMQERKPFVVRGAASPISGELHMAQFFHGLDGLGNSTTKYPEVDVPKEVINAPTHPKLLPMSKPGYQVGLDTLRELPAREVSYCVLGPTTNLALMMREDAKLVREKIGRVSFMGGALDVPGNKTPVAEFNWFADAFSCGELLTPREVQGVPAPHEGLPLSRVIIHPLDITSKHALHFPWYKEVIDATFNPDQPGTASAEGKTPIVRFTSAFLEHVKTIMGTRGKNYMEMHDVVAVWTAISNPPVKDAAIETELGLTEGWEIQRRKFDMERTGELTRGMCVIDRRNHDEGAYAPGANRAKVQAALEKAHVPHGPFESTVVPVAAPKPEYFRISENTEGVPVLVRSPGAEALTKIMAERVWGISA